MNLAAERYDRFIAPVLNQYRRPFSMIDIGAGAEPYNSFETARRYDATVVAIEQNADYAEESIPRDRKLMVLKHRFTPGDLADLASRAHFDVVLAMNVLHHFGNEWKEAWRAIESMGSQVIYQTPYADATGVCGQDVVPEIEEWLRRRYRMMGESVQWPGHQPRPIYYSYPGKWLVRPVNSDKSFVVLATSDYKRVGQLKDDEFRPWIHGINLWRWRRYGGWWPRLDTVIEKLRAFPLPERNHGDIVPWNFIFDGQGLHLIDGFEGWEFDDRVNLEKTVVMMQEGNDNLLRRERGEEEC